MTEANESQAPAVEILSREICFQGFYRMARFRLRHRQFSGALGPELEREVFVRPDAVCVLPYDAVRDEVVLIEQFRVGVMEKTAHPWLLEPVAGLVDKQGEAVEAVAHREAEEEAGLTLQSLWPISTYFPSPSSTWVAAAPWTPVASMAWKRRARTFASMSGRWTRHWQGFATVESITQRQSSPCNGWRSIAPRYGGYGAETARSLSG